MRSWIRTEFQVWTLHVFIQNADFPQASWSEFILAILQDGVWLEGEGNRNDGMCSMLNLLAFQRVKSSQWDDDLVHSMKNVGDVPVNRSCQWRQWDNATICFQWLWNCRYWKVVKARLRKEVESAEISFRQPCCEEVRVTFHVIFPNANFDSAQPWIPHWTDSGTSCHDDLRIWRWSCVLCGFFLNKWDFHLAKNVPINKGWKGLCLLWW